MIVHVCAIIIILLWANVMLTLHGVIIFIPLDVNILYTEHAIHQPQPVGLLPLAQYNNILLRFAIIVATLHMHLY